MSDRDLKSARPAKRNWGKIILIFSLALNLLFIGAVVGAGWMRSKYGSSWEGPTDFAAKRLLRHLPETKQQFIFDQIKSNRKVRRVKLKSIRALKQKLTSALKNEPFNSDKVRDVAQKLHSARGGLVDDRTELLIDVLSKLTPEERNKILESRLFRRLLSPGVRSSHRRRWRERREQRDKQ